MNTVTVVFSFDFDDCSFMLVLKLMEIQLKSNLNKAL